MGSEANAACPTLLRALADSDGLARVWAARALIRIGMSEVAGPALTSTLVDPDEKVRRAAARALGDSGTAFKGAAVALAGALEDRSEKVRDEAISSLGKLGSAAPSAVGGLLKLMGDQGLGRKAATALAASGPAVVPALIEKLGAPEGHERRHACIALHELGARAAPATRALVELLYDPDDHIRTEAAETLGAIGPAAAPALPGLCDALKDRGGQVSFYAVEALGAFGEAALPARQALIDSLEDSGDWTRLEAARALCKLGPCPQALACLRNLARSSDLYVRVPALEGLWRAGRREEVRQYLSRALQDRSADVRHEALSCVWGLESDGRPLAPMVVPALKDPSLKVRRLAAQILRMLDAWEGAMRP